MIVNDLYCPECGFRVANARFNVAFMPACQDCGGILRQDWSHGQAPATDLHAERHFDGLDGTFTSTRQAEQQARDRAAAWSSEMQRSGIDASWTIDGCGGDKQGGARDVRRVRGSAFGYAGKASRQSTGERQTI